MIYFLSFMEAQLLLLISLIHAPICRHRHSLIQMTVERCKKTHTRNNRDMLTD
ncbi:hypothetical protein LZ31DRAFT_550531, partial [Colletotrichum somersetense]